MDDLDWTVSFLEWRGRLVTCPHGHFWIDFFYTLMIANRTEYPPGPSHPSSLPLNACFELPLTALLLWLLELGSPFSFPNPSGPVPRILPLDSVGPHRILRLILTQTSTRDRPSFEHGHNCIKSSYGGATTAHRAVDHRNQQVNDDRNTCG